MINEFKDDYAFLSNFHILHNPIVYNNILYRSVEHFYQAMKTKDLKQREFIASLPYPGQDKKVGNKVELRPDWNAVKVQAMAFGLQEKFKDFSLARKLIETYPKSLVEGNYWHDNYWGSCGCKACAPKSKINMLGRLLELLRTHLINDQPLAATDLGF